MNRYFSAENLERVCADFAFLVKKISDYRGELDLRLRDNYFNLYYRGNSLAKVTPVKDGCYDVVIHRKFSREIFRDDPRFTCTDAGSHCRIRVRNRFLRPLFKKKNLDALLRNIKKVNYGEEIVFEQLLITDNVDRDDLILIDRQVTEPGMNSRIDLLALKRTQGNHFSFVVIEVKLGNNRELAGAVGKQLNGYIHHIESHIEEWACSYRETYRQMKLLKILEPQRWDEIEIDRKVEGLVVVSGYSGIARESIRQLQNSYPEIAVRFIKNRI